MSVASRRAPRVALWTLPLALAAAGAWALVRARRRPRAPAARGGIPRDPALDASLALLREGYRFVGHRCERLGSDVFETRLMLRRAVCAVGPEAAHVFYVPGRFTRRDALPPTTVDLLQARGSALGLDGVPHRHRKAMLLSLLPDVGLDALADALDAEWRAALERWQRMDAIVLHRAVEEVLCRAAGFWAGIPAAELDAPRRTRELGAMIDGGGSAGARAWRGLLLRGRTERWARDLVRRVRAGALEPAPGTALEVLARHRELDGGLLPARVAAVELVNLLQPTVAVARYVVFAALALHEHPDAGADLRAGGETALRRFVDEVRRFYPLVPLVGGRVLEPFEWRGRRFRRGDWMLLDLYATDHDPRAWGDPEVFRPGRFASSPPTAFTLVPQGGGEVRAGHRCAGEGATVALLERAVRLLTDAMTYDVPPQDLRVDLSRIPALPASGFVIRDVRAIAPRERAAAPPAPPPP